jgi:hypothetical protein
MRLRLRFMLQQQPTRWGEKRGRFYIASVPPPRARAKKMEALYDYLTSPQFAQKLRAVFETFKKMKEEPDSEKNVTIRRWARREKALQAGMNQLLGIGGEIQGLSQQELPMLQLEAERSGEA